MVSNSINIVIGGEAGQGLVTIGQLLAKGLVRNGYFIAVTQGYQSRIRGGHNTFAIRTGTDPILAPQESIDLLIALDEQTVSLHQPELSRGGLMVVDRDWKVKGPACLEVPFKELAAEKFVNILALGVIGALLGLPEEGLVSAVEDFFGHKAPSSSEENHRALKTAYQWTEGRTTVFPKLPPISNLPRRLMMNGNEAVALGALSAGLKFFSFYPMTPSTSIALSLAARAKTMGLIVEQAEDEIAAVNMAIGASFVGAPSMVATSGGGFALMGEGVSLAGMTETPLVIIVAQRPGPATGLPTRTEQGDLEFILHAGHGEFPRAVFTPGTVEECFLLTRKALELAESFQTPIFLLTDQFLADSYRAVNPFDVKGLSWIHPGYEGTPSSTPYLRYAFTENGLSPRFLPGKTENLVVADSDEHTEDGHLTEDLSVREQMMEKRLKKLEALTRQGVPPEFTGDEGPELLLVTWGSTKGSVLEAASILKLQGKRVGALCFSQVWPLVPEQFIDYLEGAEEVIGVEGNALGQFSRLLRRETGFPITKKVLRYDGLPITPEYILKQLAG
ncbi:MAG: pyruvate ferredoxin oxidoreductase [Deltaproteobacteria bacterium RBG_13_43_22]|nr:MAG: pyruvate ferredoxin oxidoreductase [Deltaproteobacteria bacterium RBG_13_43_22]